MMTLACPALSAAHIADNRSDQEVVALVELDEMLVLPHFAPVDHRRGGFLGRARQVGRVQNGNQLLMQVNAIAILRMCRGFSFPLRSQLRRVAAEIPKNAAASPTVR